MEIRSYPLQLPDTAKLAAKIRTDQETIDRLTGPIHRHAQVSAVFKICYLDEKNDAHVKIEGVRFSSRVLARNLSAVGRVFPYVFTLGPAMDELIDSTGDMLDKYLLDQIANIALEQSRKQLAAELKSRFELDKVSSMAPGSLEDWPIEEQKHLFRLLDGVETDIRVHLTDSCLMIPRKSLSGIYFPADSTFKSCRLCPRAKCDSRKARYDKALAHEYGLHN